MRSGEYNGNTVCVFLHLVNGFGGAGFADVAGNGWLVAVDQPSLDVVADGHSLRGAHRTIDIPQNM